jgi:hypothetical protein
MAMNEIKIFKKSMSHRDIVMKASYANFHMVTMMLGIFPGQSVAIPNSNSFI